MTSRELKGIQISRLGLGTVQFGMDYGYVKAKSQNEVDDILKACLECGINFLDTARDYGDSEEKIGSFLERNPGSGFVIATKLAKIESGVAGEKKRLCDSLLKSVETSIKRLKVKRIELLQLHQSDEFIIGDDNFWGCIAELKESGRIRLFGVSFYDAGEARRWISERGAFLDFIQAPYNVFDRRFESLFPELETKRIGLISRSTFLKGIITANNGEIPEELRALGHFKEKLLSFSREVGLSVEELALLFVARSRFIVSTLLGVRSAEELRVNAAVLQKIASVEPLNGKLDELDVREPFLIDPARWLQFFK